MNAEAQKAEDEFDFEIEEEQEVAEQETVEEPEQEEPELEIKDDTPEEDQGHSPMPQEIVEELESDELEDYSEKVKQRLKQMKKVWHDERREKEKANREQQEAVRMAQQAIEENKRLKASLSKGEETLAETYKQAAELEMKNAERSYKEAHELGDTDQMLSAQRELTAASYKLQQAQTFKPRSLQQGEVDVQPDTNEFQAPKPDARTLAWQERNTWFGQDQEMTALALGLHQKLEQERGAQFIGTDDYWQTVDTTMRRRFPDYFGEDETIDGGGKPVKNAEKKPATVVAPASRSRSPKKIVLTRSQVNIAKKLGLTPEQYARELKKMGN
ncbi:MAG: hypothetical protein ACPHEP_09360 [Acidimicrobiales bacterium]